MDEYSNSYYPKRKWNNEAENLFEEIMTKIFPNMEKKKISWKRITQRHMPRHLIKMSKVKGKKILKKEQEKNNLLCTSESP